jgi:hypothetical protein
MTMAYKVTSALVVVRDDKGAFHHFYEGAVLPAAGLDDEHVAQLADEGMLKEVEVAPATEPEPETTATKPTTVEDILAEVGDDKDKAAAALEEELASSKPRKTLLESLEAILSGS